LLNLILKNATDIKPKQAECVSSSEGAENIQPQKKKSLRLGLSLSTQAAYQNRNVSALRHLDYLQPGIMRYCKSKVPIIITGCPCIQQKQVSI
jgi:hypothetical protein